MSVPAGYRSRPAALADVDAVDESGAVHLYRNVGMTAVREWLDYERSIAGDGRA